MKFFVTRVQRGVGQGGFHTCRVLLQRNHIFGNDLPFEFAYDCGTNSVGPGGLAIEPFLEQHIADYDPAEGVVDALFISHLDRDHYNGAAQLCKVKKVQRIFLPYFTIEELILLLLDQIIAGSGVSVPFAQAMASIATGGRRLFGAPVTVIGGTANILRDPIQGSALGNGNRLEAVVIGDDGQYYPIGDDISAGANIGLVASRRALPWILRPWSYKQTAAARKLMQDLIAGVPELKDLHDHATAISQAHITAIENNKDSVRAGCQAIIAKAKGTIASDFKDNNAPSICLYSSPKSRLTQKYSAEYIERGTPESLVSSNPVGWLTTGDALISRHWQDFIACFRDLIGLTGTFVVPHHGAEKNHSPDFAAATAGRVAVICARHGSLHHPHRTVLDDLYANNAIAKVVDEYAVHGLREIATVDTPGI